MVQGYGYGAYIQLFSPAIEKASARPVSPKNPLNREPYHLIYNPTGYRTSCTGNMLVSWAGVITAVSLILHH